MDALSNGKEAPSGPATITVEKHKNNFRTQYGTFSDKPSENITRWLEEAEEEEEEAEVQVQDDQPYQETPRMATTLITCKQQMANCKDQSMDFHSATTVEEQATKGKTAQ